MSIWRILGIIAIFGATSIGWFVLGGVTSMRTGTQSRDLEGAVHELWGRMQTQEAPRFVFHREDIRRSTRDGVLYEETVYVPEVNRADRTRVDVDLGLDARRKGLMWYALYDVDFAGGWRYTHAGPAGPLDVVFPFPDAAGIYDGFRFVVDGVDRTDELQPEGGQVALRMQIAPDQTIELQTAYRSRGLESWRYRPADGVSRLEDFQLTMTTDFADIDYPYETLSPSARERTEAGWTLTWAFEQVVTGHGVGMQMPTEVQPGELATELSLSAPISLLFFFLVIFVLDRLRDIGMHPVNYLFLAGAFFAFHLLFAYSADHLPVEAAFALASAVSVLLVVSYLRLVVSNRFAFVEAAAAQLVYLVGFSLAHFWAGYTGLTVTVLSVLTLFLLMQWTGRVDWSEALSRKPAPKPRPQPA